MGKTFRPDAAEREANEIAFRFQNSNDVMGDMSRAYHVDFSNIKIHTDGAADSKVKAAGKDALAKGNDLFFGKGIFESNDPGSKGLLAHELAHTMQQGAADGGEGAVSEMAPMGAEQGGRLRDWFKRRFSSKKDTGNSEEDIEISGPTLMDDPNASDFTGYQLHTDDPDEQKLRFMSTQSRAIYEMAKSVSPEQLRKDPQLRELILNDYKTSMSDRLQGYEDKSYGDMYSSVFRGDSTGELASFNMLMNASMPQNLAFEMGDIYDGTSKSEDKMFRYGADQIYGDDKMMKILKAGMKGFAGSSHFEGEKAYRQSETMMENVLLHGLTPTLSNFAKNTGNDKEKQRQYRDAAKAMKHGGTERFRRLLFRSRMR